MRGQQPECEIELGIHEASRILIDPWERGEVSSGSTGIYGQTDGELHLADDVELVPEQQTVVAVDAAGQRVLHEEHDAVGDPGLQLEWVAA